MQQPAGQERPQEGSATHFGMIDAPDVDVTPSQETEQGYEIPVPTKDRVMRFFEKVAKPTKPKQG